MPESLDCLVRRKSVFYRRDVAHEGEAKAGRFKGDVCAGTLRASSPEHEARIDRHQKRVRYECGQLARCKRRLFGEMVHFWDRFGGWWWRLEKWGRGGGGSCYRGKHSRGPFGSRALAIRGAALELFSSTHRSSDGK